MDLPCCKPHNAFASLLELLTLHPRRSTFKSTNLGHDTVYNVIRRRLGVGSPARNDVWDRISIIIRGCKYRRGACSRKIDTRTSRVLLTVSCRTSTAFDVECVLVP
eukprot:scaffold476155_cov46-Prasinocladus_malaysianus.AAC.1